MYHIQYTLLQQLGLYWVYTTFVLFLFNGIVLLEKLHQVPKGLLKNLWGCWFQMTILSSNQWCRQCHKKYAKITKRTYKIKQVQRLNVTTTNITEKTLNICIHKVERELWTRYFKENKIEIARNQPCFIRRLPIPRISVNVNCISICWQCFKYTFIMPRP